MLRSWRRRLRVVLSGSGAAWASGAESGECPGGPAEAFALALRAPHRPVRSVSVVLGGALVRSLVVPWSPEVADDAEGLALASHHFRRVFGPAAERWEVRFDLGGGPRRLACAVDRELLQALRAAAAGARCRIESIEPFVVDAFNRSRRDLPRGPALFVALERERWACARMDGREWRELRAGRLDAGPRDFLPELIARERALAGEDLPVQVFAPDHPSLSGGAGMAGVHILAITGESAHASRPA